MWRQFVQWNEADNDRLNTYQDEAGRLWDVVRMAAYGAREARKRDPNANELRFRLYSIERRAPAELTENELKLILGPGDAGEPVATILLPNED